MITQEVVKALSDNELEQVNSWTQSEQKARIERHKQETIAKIKELARSIELGVKLAGTRGRPAKNPATTASQKYSRPPLKKQ